MEKKKKIIMEFAMRKCRKERFNMKVLTNIWILYRQAMVIRKMKYAIDQYSASFFPIFKVNPIRRFDEKLRTLYS